MKGIKLQAKFSMFSLAVLIASSSHADQQKIQAYLNLTQPDHTQLDVPTKVTELSQSETTSNFIPPNMGASQDSDLVFNKIASHSVRYFMRMGMKAGKEEVRNKIKLLKGKFNFFFFHNEASNKNKLDEKTVGGQPGSMAISVNPIGNDAKLRVYTTKRDFFSVKISQDKQAFAYEHTFNAKTTLSLSLSQNKGEQIHSINLAMNW